MALSRTERLMARRQVKAEIASDPVCIQLQRKTRIPDGAGGYREGNWADTEKKTTVLIAPAKRRLSAMLVNTELGDLVDYPYIVLAPHTADIRRNDRFKWNGDTFVVQSVHIKDEVSKVAQVDYFGGTNNG